MSISGEVVASSQNQECLSCGNDFLTKLDSGILICDICGTQSQSFQEEVGEWDALLFSGFSVRKGKQYSEKKNLVTPGRKLNFYEAFQIILKRHCSALVRVCGICSSIEQVIGEIWIAYLMKRHGTQQDLVSYLSESIPQIPIDRLENEFSKKTFDSSECFGAEDYSLGSERNREESFSEVNPSILEHYSLPKSALFLSISYLACLLLRQPILETELLDWAKNGTLPFFRAFKELPLPLERPSLLWLLGPWHFPSPSYILSQCSHLSNLLQIDIPPLNFRGCLMKSLYAFHFKDDAIKDIFQYIETVVRLTEPDMNIKPLNPLNWTLSRLRKVKSIRPIRMLRGLPPRGRVIALMIIGIKLYYSSDIALLEEFAAFLVKYPPISVMNFLSSTENAKIIPLNYIKPYANFCKNTFFTEEPARDYRNLISVIDRNLDRQESAKQDVPKKECTELFAPIVQRSEEENSMDHYLWYPLNSKRKRHQALYEQVAYDTILLIASKYINLSTDALCEAIHSIEKRLNSLNKNSESDISIL